MFKKPYDFNVRAVCSDKGVTQETALILEGYALALVDMMYRLSGESPCEKSYDPLLIENPHTAHSYTFDMKDGGRHHDLGDYKDLGEIMDILLQEAVDWLKETEPCKGREVEVDGIVYVLKAKGKGE